MRKIAGATLGVLLAGGAVFVGSKQFASVGPAVVAAGRPCDVTITTPAPDKGSGRGVLSRHNTESLTVALVGKARRCPSATVTIFVKEGAGAETTYDTATTDSAGAWSKDVIVTDAVSTRIRAAMASGPSAVLTVNANTGLPKVAIGAPVADSAGVLRVVAPAVATGCGGEGNSHVYLGEPGWVADTSCTAGGQVVTSVVVTGANGGTYSISYAGVVLSSGAISSSPQTLTPTLTLPDHTRADLVFTATNGTGSTVATYPTRVMTAIPTEVRGPDGGVNAFVTRITDARGADVEIDFVLPTVAVEVESASLELAWTTGLIAGPVGDGGSQKHHYDGGRFLLDGGGSPLDLGVFLLGSSETYQSPPFPNRGWPGTTKGLVYRHPDLCVLYDPSVTPQTWECIDGTTGVSGTTHTARVFGLPPLNTYYFWILQKF